MENNAKGPEWESNLQLSQPRHHCGANKIYCTLTTKIITAEILFNKNNNCNLVKKIKKTSQRSLSKWLQTIAQLSNEREAERKPDIWKMVYTFNKMNVASSLRSKQIAEKCAQRTRDIFFFFQISCLKTQSGDFVCLFVCFCAAELKSHGTGHLRRSHACWQVVFFSVTHHVYCVLF